MYSELPDISSLSGRLMPVRPGQILSNLAS